MNKDIPRLIKDGAATRLLVDGAPFIALAGELHNSSASNEHYMKPFWKQFKQMNLNTILAPVTWELLEPEAGQFDYTQVDALLRGARENRLRLILLWFGTWKNAMSTYVPAWVKTDTKTYIRAQNESAEQMQAISCLCENTCKADANAFAHLMEYIRINDEHDRTVIAVQVENEPGLLYSPRDYSPLACQSFASDVPAELLSYLKANTDSSLLRGVKQDSGTWAEVFGINANEVFMAYHTAAYINTVASAGKEKYILPMYVNAWTVQNRDEPPGSYPSGGPVSKMMPVYKAAAPSIDVCAPDLYLDNKFVEECKAYSSDGNPLFIPETRADRWAPAYGFYALGNHNTLLFSPFGIEDIGGDTDSKDKAGLYDGAVVQQVLKDMVYCDISGQLGMTYDILSQLTPLIAAHQESQSIAGVLQQGARCEYLEMNGFRLLVEYNQALNASEFPAGGIIIATGEAEFIIAGFGFHVKFSMPSGRGKTVDYLSIDECRFQDGIWVNGRRLNGDEQRVCFGSRPGILRIKLYCYDK